MSNGKYMTAEEILSELIERYPSLAPMKDDIRKAVDIMNSSWQNGGVLYTCGNGGSCSDSGHIVGELMKCFKIARPIDSNTLEALNQLEGGSDIASHLEGALPAVSLCAQAPLMTAFMNDADPSLVFAQQVYGYGRLGDVLLTISTSGNSKNCVAAAITAKAKKMSVISMTGASGGKLADISDVCLKAPETETFKVQELHLPIYHCLCAMAEAENFRQ